MITITRVTLSNAQLVTGLFDAYRVFYKQAPDKHLAEAFIAERLGNNESVIYVALHGDVPVGFTQLYPKYSSVRAVKNWILNDLYVDPDYRKQGIGELLIQVGVGFASEHKAKFVQLETAIDNYPAQSLYNRMGFTVQGPDTEYLLYKLAL